MKKNQIYKKITNIVMAVVLLVTGYITGRHAKNEENKIDVINPSLIVGTENKKDLEYTIKSGDSLSEVAEKFGISVQEIIGKNNLIGNTIYAGDTLIIPNVSEKIMNKYYEELGKTQIDEEKINVEYKVVSNDSLKSIAEMFNVSVESIIETNNIKDKNKIYKNTILIIPNVSKELVDKMNSESNDAPNITDDNNIENQNNGLPEGYTRGIDISAYNGELDWDILETNYKKGNFNFIIIRMAENFNKKTRNYEFTLDELFEKNLSECNKRGIPYGVYVFSRANSEIEINKETTSIINYINNNLNQTKIVNGEELDLTFNLSLPLYMDCFEQDAKRQIAIFNNGDYNTCEKLIKTWCDAIEEAGYFTGVYCSGNFYSTMGIERLKDYSLWIAHYGSAVVTGNVETIELNNKVKFGPIIKNQQVTEKGKIEGIEHYFDVNIMDEDLFKIVDAYYSRKNHILTRNN